MFFFCLVEFVYLSKFSYEDFFQRLCIRAFHKRLVFTFQTAQAHVHTDIPYQQEDSKNQQYNNDDPGINPKTFKNATHITVTPNQWIQRDL